MSEPQVSDAERRRRWRLVLGGAADVADGASDGPASDDPASDGPASDGPASDGADGDGADGDGPAPGGSGPLLDGDDVRIDAALGTITDPDIHSDGEYSIEIVIQKAHA